MVKLSITVGANNIQIDTNASFEDVVPILNMWFAAIAVAPAPPRADHLVLTVGAVSGQNLPAPTGVPMSIQLTDTQQVGLSVAGADAKGFPAPIESVVFTSSDATVAAVTADATDPTKANVVAGNPGTAQVVVTADAQIGDGVVPLTGTLDVVVVAGQAATLGITAGTPVAQ